MKLTDFTRDILFKVNIKDNIVYLPPITLNRSEYAAVDKALSLMGGKWNRKVRGHVFEADPMPAIRMALETGEIEDTKKMYQFYPTPNEVAVRMCELACLDENSVALEPSCGDGALADVIWQYTPKSLHGIELNPAMNATLASKPYTTQCGVDFLNVYESQGWNRIIMNPPFAKGQDIKHVLHAFDLLNPGGILVAITGAAGMFHTDKASVAFREFLNEQNAEIEKLPAGTFKQSGTMVETYIIRIHKGEAK